MRTKKCPNYVSLKGTEDIALLSDMHDSIYLASKGDSFLKIDIRDNEWYLFNELFAKLSKKIEPTRYIVSDDCQNKEQIQKFQDEHVTRLLVKSSDTDDYLILANMFDVYFLELHATKKNKPAVIRFDALDDEIGTDFLEFYHKLTLLDEKIHQITIVEYMYSQKRKAYYN